MYGIRYLMIQSLHHVCHLSEDVCHSVSCTFNTETVFVFFCAALYFFLFYLISCLFVFYTFPYGVYLCILCTSDSLSGARVLLSLIIKINKYRQINDVCYTGTLWANK